MNIMKLIVIITGLILINVIIWAIILSGTFPRDADIHPGYIFLIITISTFLCIIIYEKTRKKWKKERKDLIDQLEKAFNEFEIGYIIGEEYIESTSALREIIEKSRKWEKQKSLFLFSSSYKSRLESMDNEARVKLAVKKHLSALRRNLDKAIRKNDYGAVEFDGTNEEISRFLVSVGFDSVDAKSGEYISIVKETVAECEAQLEKSEFDPLDLPDDGFEFEFWVADNLKKFGWDAKATAGAGDQGVDVIAVKNDIKVGIQCKLYSGSVGNKAVQEIIAARDYFDLDFAAVLTNADYTKSAKELALKSKVKLLTQYDIPDFDDLFL